MKNKIKNLTYACLAAGILLLVPLFLSREKAIEVDLPELNLAELEAQEEAQQKAAKASAERTFVRRIYQCELDEDCIIVESDPCGCWAGPSGVTAINATRVVDFNKLHSKSVAKTCPDGAPSAERECSPSARAVCREKTCKIEY